MTKANQNQTSRRLNRKVAIGAALAALCLSPMGVQTVCAAPSEVPVSVPAAQTIKGTVVDQTGEPVIGASIKVKGSRTGAVTDVDGNFQLTANAGDEVEVSYIGSKTTSFTVVAGRTSYNVTLEEDRNALDEVVVVGYGVQRKSDLTGAVASVKASDALRSMPTGNISDALQGRMAGVSVLSGSGNPTEDNTIRVRGINSIQAETGPLIVIDGFIGGSLNNLNPNDIASVEVLKDASATAVYGSRGANGVILVTTRNAEEGSVRVDFNAFVNLKTVGKYPDNMSPYEYANLVNDYAQEVQDYGANYYYSAADLEAFKSGKRGFDYSREIFRSPAVTQNYELSISGSGERTRFLASLRYQDDQGIIKESRSQLYTWRLKVDTKIKKWLEAGLNVYGSYRKNEAPRFNEYDGLIQQAMYFPNTIMPKDENGDYNNSFFEGSPSYNPMGYIWESNNVNKVINNRIQGYVQFNIIDGLTFRSQLGVSLDNRLASSVSNEASYYYYKNNLTQAQSRSYWNTGWLNTNTLSYIKEFNENHRVNATAVYEQSYSNNYDHTGTAYNLDYIDRIGYDNLAWSDASLATIASDRTITTLQSVMLRANYVFRNRYMVTASIRADGSSRLDDKWSYFPSAALAWDMKQESFLKDNIFISQLKLRVGYGSVGNQSVAAYRIYSKMEPVRNSDGSTSYKVSRPSAPYLKWERNNQFNVGVDFAVLNGRVRLTADWYDKLSKDILLELAQPTHMGYGSLLMNSGEIRNRGIEVTISAEPVIGKDFSWHTDLTLAHNKGTFEKIPTPDRQQLQAGNYQNKIFKMVEGEKLGTFYGYLFDGVWQQADVDAPFIDADGKPNGKTNGQTYNVVPGNSKLRDNNGDGIINDLDMVKIGCGQPTFNWGWNNTLTYRNFDMALFFVGFHGFDIYNATRQIGYNLVSSQQVAGVTPMKELLNRWTPTNTDTDIPGLVKGGTEKKDFYSTRFVEDGWFIKCKSITLGYSLPKNLCNTLRINNLRVYASVQNPFVITKYKGLDPEATMGSPLIQGVDWGAYPNSRNYLIGLNFGF